MNIINKLKEYLTKKCQTIAIYSGAMHSPLMTNYYRNKPTGTRLGYCKYSPTYRALYFKCNQPGRMGYMRITNWFGFGCFEDFDFGDTGRGEHITLLDKIDCKQGDLRMILFI